MIKGLVKYMLLGVVMGLPVWVGMFVDWWYDLPVSVLRSPEGAYMGELHIGMFVGVVTLSCWLPVVFLFLFGVDKPKEQVKGLCQDYDYGHDFKDYSVASVVKCPECGRLYKTAVERSEKWFVGCRTCGNCEGVS